MGKIKLGFRLCLFSLFVFVLTVIKADSSDSSTSPNPNGNPNVDQEPEFQTSLVLERLDALETRFLEEMSRQFESSQKNWNDQFKSLKKELEDMKNENSVNEDVWLLTPPLGGRRGEKGEKGDSSGFRGSQSMPIRPAVPLKTNNGKEVPWKINRPGENWIVAKGISHWEPNGRWGNAQLCPPATFVTAHQFMYFSNSGLTEVELTCTNKYNTNKEENDHSLRIRSADVSKITAIGEEWDIQDRGSRTNFAKGFSLNRIILESRGSTPEIRKMSKTYDMIYHGQNPEESASNFSGTVTKCPENHAICGLIPMMDNKGLGILSAIGFKCCSICTPEEKWVTVYQFNNTESSNETVKFNTFIGLQQSLQNLISNSTFNSTSLDLESIVDSVGIFPSDFYQEFSTHLAKSNSTGFDWTATEVSMETEETNLTKTFTCKAQSLCVYQQLVGQCGSVQIPVDKFCQGSAPIGSPIPESCTDWTVSSCSDAKEISPSPRFKKQIIYPLGNSKSLEVLRDFKTDGGGWTIIQKRSSGPLEDFKRGWSEYVKGFGSLDGNFWLGLDNIRALTKNGDQELRLDLEDFQGNKKHAKYSSFSISDASDFYRLSVDGYCGNAGDSFVGPTLSPNANLNGSRFSTIDNDNDKFAGNCARNGQGGWWFNSCFYAHLNGLYPRGENEEWVTTSWGVWKRGSETTPLAKTEMKIRTRK